MRKQLFIHAAFWLLVTGTVRSQDVAEENWPQFRGPSGSGVAAEAAPPEHWSTTENVAWVTDIPGRGWSSPILWGKTVFVTSAISTGGGYKEPSTGIFGNDYLDTFVIQPGDTHKEIGMNRFGEMSFASPAISGDSLFIRTMTKLYRISE